MRRVVRSGFALALAVCPVLLSLLTASSLHAQQRQALQTQVAAPAGAKLIGRLPGSQRLRLAISLPLRNQEQLDNLLRQLYDPASPNYRHFLTVEQFTEQFGPSVGDYQRVIGFAQSHGLKVVRSFPNRLALSVSGSVANIEQAFQVTMQVYEHPTENRTFSAPDVEPTVESGVPVLSVDGLSTYNLPHSMLKRATPNEGVHSNQTGSGPGGQFLGSDMRTAYGGGTALDGSGQAIGLIELGPYRLTDVLDYFSTLSQTLSVPIVNVLLDADGICAGSPPFGCDDGEEVVRVEELVFLAVELDFRSAILADQDAVADLDFKRDFLAVVVGFAGAEGTDNAFGGFFLGGIGDDDAALLHFFLFDRLNQDPVAEGFNV